MSFISTPFLFEITAFIFICVAIVIVLKDAQKYKRELQMVEMKLAKLRKTSYESPVIKSNIKMIDW